MFKVQFKSKSPTEAWHTVGTYGSESLAINSALRKKTSGALMVRVVDKKGKIIYTN